MSGRVGVAMLGGGFIAQFHAWCLRTAELTATPPRALPELVSVCDVDAAAADATRTRFGWAETTADWRAQVADPRVGLIVNAGPNRLHVEPSLAAARAGRHVFCEKPLAPTADEALRAWAGVAAAGVVHMVGFMKRFIPALCLAREMIRGGELGDVRHYRAAFLMDTALDPDEPMSWRFDRVHGTGALGDLGAHHVDLAHFLVGDFARVSACTRTFIPERPGGRVSVDDAVAAIGEFENGATATLTASRAAGGQGVTSRIEIEGTRGALRWEAERLNELLVAGADRGYRVVQATGSGHPFGDFWWTGGIQGQHPLGWVDCFVHQMHRMLDAVGGGPAVPPHGATFRDGYRAAEVCDTILRAAESGRREAVAYRAPDGSG